MAKSAPSLATVRAAQRKAMTRLGRVGEVNGIGITRLGAGYGLKINLSAQPRGKARLPTQIDGVPIQVEVVGPIRRRSAV